jgi:hypothetical protein
MLRDIISLTPPVSAVATAASALFRAPSNEDGLRDFKIHLASASQASLVFCDRRGHAGSGNVGATHKGCWHHTYLREYKYESGLYVK